MTDTTPTTPRPKPRFNPWPFGIAALLLSVVVADAVMLVIAQRNPPEMVERPPIPSLAPDAAPVPPAPAPAPTPPETTP